jgi:hypothetical protein
MDLDAMQWVKKGVKFASYLLNGMALGALVVATDCEQSLET